MMDLNTHPDPSQRASLEAATPPEPSSPSPTTEALALFQGKYNCAQAILLAFGPAYGLDAETAIKLGRPFGSGMGGRGLTCGAVTGAVMILGLAHPEMPERQAKKEAYRRVRELAERFEARHGSILCRDLLDADPNTRMGRASIRLRGLSRKACPGFVQAVAEILEAMLPSPAATPGNADADPHGSSL